MRLPGRNASSPDDLPELPGVAADYLDSVDALLTLPVRDRVEIQDELAAHLVDSIEALIAEGLDEERATREAIARLGRPEELARQLEAARRTTRRLLAGAAGGVFQAGVGVVWGWFLGWLLVLLAAVAGSLLVATILKPPVDFLARYLPALDTDFNDTGIGPAIMAGVLAFTGWIAARRGVRATYQISRRNPNRVKLVWAAVGGPVLVWLSLFVYTTQQNWLTVAGESAIPVAFVVGAIKFDWASHVHVPGGMTLAAVGLAVLLPVVLLAGMTTSGGGSSQASPVDYSVMEKAYDRVAPAAWATNVPPVVVSESGITEYRPSLVATYKQWAGASLSEFHDIRFEVWRGVSIEPVSELPDYELVPDPLSASPFLSRPVGVTANGTFSISLDMSKVRANRWLVFVTGARSDGHRYRLDDPWTYFSTFDGTVWDWLTARD